MARDLERTDIEKANIRRRFARHLLHDLESIRTLDLVPESLALPLVYCGPLVSLRRGLIPAGFHIELNPIRSGRAADQIEAVLIEIEENRIADHVTVMVTGDELLGLAGLEILEAVDAKIVEEFQ